MMSRKSEPIRQQSKEYMSNVPRILARGKRKAEDVFTDSDCSTNIPENKKKQISNAMKEPEQCIPSQSSANLQCQDHVGNISLCTPVEQPLTGSNFRHPSLESFLPLHMLRFSPLPDLSWADSDDVWSLMCKKERIYIRDRDMLDRHPSLQSRMRSILLDWLTEVCEVYKLHRETYYLAVDYIDRYLASEENLPKHQLQLTGITSLFIAAKLEEIYPPRLKEFAYVTDGACTEAEILDKELIVLKMLKWDLTPMTVNSWLNVYLQVTNLENREGEGEMFVVPQYSPHVFVQVAQLIDLAMLDIGCLQFSYSVLAASAIYHLSSQHVALGVSGFSWQDIAQCVHWMAPFAVTIRESGGTELRLFPKINPEDSHHIQTHGVDLMLLERAQARQEEVIQSSRSSPVMGASSVSDAILTPPESNKKHTSVSNMDIVPQNSGL